ncbi:hypothetical protein FA95DRAFT_1472703, partial [Auriscalpium vulgare]
WERTSKLVLIGRWEAYLLGFVDDPARFRGVLRTTASVASGSTVLHFLMKNSPLDAVWEPGDLDVFCPITSAETLLEHLTNIEGYRNKNPTHTVCADEDEYMGDNTGGLFQVVHLERPDGKEIDLVVSSRQTPLWALTYFWGTLVLSYISADTICVAYPLWTLAGVGRLHPERSSFFQAKRCVAKYTERGFQLLQFDSKDKTTYHSKYCPHLLRTFFDRACLRLSF